MRKRSPEPQRGKRDELRREEEGVMVPWWRMVLAFFNMGFLHPCAMVVGWWQRRRRSLSALRRGY